MNGMAYFKGLMGDMLSDSHNEKELFANIDWENAHLYLTDEKQIEDLHFDIYAVLFASSLKNLATSGMEHTILSSAINGTDDKLAYFHFFYCGKEYEVSLSTKEKLLTIKVIDALFLQISYDDYDDKYSEEGDLKNYCPLIAFLKKYAESSLDAF